MKKISLPLPHEGIEDLFQIEMQAAVKANGPRIRFGHRQRKQGEVSLAQIALGGRHQRFANSPRAILRQNANLSDVADVGADARAQDQSNQTFRPAIPGHERGVGIEHAASGEAHDIVEKAQRSTESVICLLYTSRCV